MKSNCFNKGGIGTAIAMPCHAGKKDADPFAAKTTADILQSINPFSFNL